MRNIKFIFAFFVAIVISVSINAASIELEWSMKDYSNITGYNLTMWTESGLVVTTKLGKINTVKIDTLTGGKRYIFQIIPLNMSGTKGEASNFIVYDVPSLKTNIIKNGPQLRLKLSNQK